MQSFIVNFKSSLFRESRIGTAQLYMTNGMIDSAKREDNGLGGEPIGS